MTLNKTNIKQTADTKLRQAQLKMLEALIEIDRICKVHNINYWLDAGTLLGAVRHKGFIPWDDDIDICMTRNDYNRFLRLAPITMDKKRFFLQTSQSDPYYILKTIPCKFRINSNMRMIEYEEKTYSFFDKKSHHGLYVDIFPYDKYSPCKLIRYFERFLSIGYRLHVLTKFKGLTYFKFLASRLTKPFTKISFLEWYKKKQINYMERKEKNYLLGPGCETSFSRAYFIPEDIFPTKPILFENYFFNAPSNTEKYLLKMFGKNYMTLPPVEERKTHGYILTDDT